MSGKSMEFQFNPFFIPSIFEPISPRFRSDIASGYNITQIEGWTCLFQRESRYPRSWTCEFVFRVPSVRFLRLKKEEEEEGEGDKRYE